MLIIELTQQQYIKLIGTRDGCCASEKSRSRWNSSHLSFSNGVLTDLSAVGSSLTFGTTSEVPGIGNSSSNGAALFTITAKSGVVFTGLTQTLTGTVTGVSGAQVYSSFYSQWGVFTTGSASASVQTEGGDLTKANGTINVSDSVSFSGATTLTLTSLVWGSGFLAKTGSISGLSNTIAIQAVGTPSPVPEPTSVALALAGAGVVLMRRRAKKA